jgi:hypothetical protein
MKPILMVCADALAAKAAKATAESSLTLRMIPPPKVGEF